MTAPRLPLNINDLLHLRVIESERLEFKEGWNPDPIIRTICAFANDFQDLGGGYVVVGVAEQDGRPVLPPGGVPAGAIDRIQRELLQYCNAIQPTYFPILSVEEVGGQAVLVIWAPGGQNRPYKAPKQVTAREKQHEYFIRQYANTVAAKDDQLQELIALTAMVPFDDRINHHADLPDLKLTLIQAFLREVQSGLLDLSGGIPFAELCRQMALVDGGDEYLKPRNVGLLFFNDRPERFFPLARIELVNFVEGVGGDVIEERLFTGPVQQQLRDCLLFFRNNVMKERVIKRPDRADATRFFNYPYAAFEEALVNAVYHRSYEIREPIEVRINPDCIEILSHPGPDLSINISTLNHERIVARRYRNRRVGDFLKELKLTEGRGTGIPKIHSAMAANGSPPPSIESNPERTFFLVRLPVHASFQLHNRDQVQVEVQVEVQDEVQVDRDPDATIGTTFDLSATEQQILKYCISSPKASREISTRLGYETLTGNVREALRNLRTLGLLAYTIPDKPNSRKQRYLTTAAGAAALRLHGQG
jgi:ATP-dependent DNA helicase RecG